MNRLALYYLGYCFLFFFVHLSSVSIVTFFHFLINHDMHIVEGWLNTYAWQIVILSKLISFAFISFIFDLNHKYKIPFTQKLKELTWLPSYKALIFIFFLILFYFTLLMQFGKGIEVNKSSSEFFYLSLVGSSLYYIIDFCLLFLLFSRAGTIEIKEKLKIYFLSLFLFHITNQITLPYGNGNIILSLVHFSTLFILLVQERENLINLFCYSFFVIAPLAAFFGFDLIWESIHSLYLYKKEVPAIGIVGIWLIGLVYYLRTNSDKDNKIAVS